MLQSDKRKSDRGKGGKRGGEEERRDHGRIQEKVGKKKRRQREEGGKRSVVGLHDRQQGKLRGVMEEDERMRGWREERSRSRDGKQYVTKKKVRKKEKKE